ncbi:hypothetical protein [Streptomyces natalensis]|uniref:hypothetical protein n=1 Tax=Streptomyces natalensis TaxID=68242 RepID=UPI0012FEB6DE|nr:hypothetical protein [Streptomyces natalensis]
MARGFTAAEVEAVRGLVERSARDRSDCLDLLDALGLQSAQDRCDRQDESTSIQR